MSFRVGEYHRTNLVNDGISSIKLKSFQKADHVTRHGSEKHSTLNPHLGKPVLPAMPGKNLSINAPRQEARFSLPEVSEILSGMLIGCSEERASMFRQCVTDLTQSNSIYYYTDAEKSFRKFENFPGVERLLKRIKIPPRDTYGEKNPLYECHHYVFGTVMGEEWAQWVDNTEWNKGEWKRYYQTHRKLFLNPEPFLAENNYELITEPESGDIVAYGTYADSQDPSSQKQFAHFGIYRGNGLVASNFGLGFIFEHRIDTVPVPEEYGDIPKRAGYISGKFADRVFFYRKNKNPQIK